MSVETTDDGRFDADSEPSVAWLEQVSCEESVLATRTDNGEVRNFRVTVTEVDD